MREITYHSSGSVDPLNLQPTMAIAVQQVVQPLQAVVLLADLHQVPAAKPIAKLTAKKNANSVANGVHCHNGVCG